MEAVVGLFLMMFGVCHGELFKFMSFINTSFYSQRVVFSHQPRDPVQSVKEV